MNDEARDSQQTPQPDQPHPPVSNRPSDAPDDSPPVQTDLPVAPAEQTESD